jgi:bifunctional non-homologous end joining protein LigD
MGLTRRSEPFDHHDWLFELKWDGFRALVYKNEDGGSGLLSRNGNSFHGFQPLATASARELKVKHAVIDGEIVCLDDQGRARFEDLFYRRKQPYFYGFDLLWYEGEDLRGLPLLERKRRLKRLLQRTRSVLYVEHVIGTGKQLYEAACDMNLEGIVCKPADSRYTSSVEETTWIKIKNPNYSQAMGRDEMFDPEAEPSPWAGCHLAMQAYAGR